MKNNLMISYIFFIGAVLCEVIGTMLLPLFVNILRMRIFYRYIGLKNKGE